MILIILLAVSFFSLYPLVSLIIQSIGTVSMVTIYGDGMCKRLRVNIHKMMNG